MIAFVTFLAGICVGYVVCIWFPAQKPEKEIRYVEVMPRLNSGQRAFPEHPPSPVE